MSTQVLTLLSNSLIPSNLESVQREIQFARSHQGFAMQLMIIADDSSHDIKIRQSALIVLKNMVKDESAKAGTIDFRDYEKIKGSVLSALTRQWGNKPLTNILREIIHLIAQNDYPDKWTDILPTIITNIASSGDFNQVSASIQALKAIASVCGREIQQQVTLSNLCNQIFVPLQELIGKLFANYRHETLPILVSIFKIFNVAIFYHLPNIFVNNMHSLMVFIKKILDLEGQQLVPLKVACLKILNRMYSRHTASNVEYKHLKFAQDFHNRYSAAMVESFVKQLIDPSSNSQINNLSLNCLTCIFKNSQNGQLLIEKYSRKLLQICLNRYKIENSFQQGQSVGSIITHLREERSHLTEFIAALFNHNESILGDLIEYLNKGNQSIQQIVLYIFGALSEQVQDCQDLHQSMSQFIVTYILPILSGNSSPIMKARGCEIIAQYKYINIPQQNLSSVFQFIYSCLIQSKQSYLRIYAIEAFTQLICKYDEFQKFIVPCLTDILKVYTQLMRESHGQVYQVIKSFLLFLGQINGEYINQCAIDLVTFLRDLFYQYTQSPKNNVEQAEDSDNDSGDEDEDGSSGARQGCLACIRQIISNQGLSKSVLTPIINECVFPLAVNILEDKDLVHFQECLNILNLCLFKNDTIPQSFQMFFKVFVYAIIGIPNQLGSINLPNQYKQILQNVCLNPDQDLIPNVIGFFKNFIAKAKGQLRNFSDELGVTFLEYLYRIVENVIVSKNEKGQNKYKNNDKCCILTIFIALIQHQFLQNNQIQIIINDILKLYQFEQNNSLANTNIFIQILLILLFYSSQVTVNKINLPWFTTQLLKRQKIFAQEYQIQRYILGLGTLMDRQLLSDQQIGTALVKTVPHIMFRLVNERVKQHQQQPQIDLEEQAEQDLIADNTHMGIFKQELQQEAELQAMQEQQWNQEYNKFYYSPLLAIDETEYLVEVLGRCVYLSILTEEEQQNISQCIVNAPKKVL